MRGRKNIKKIEKEEKGQAARVTLVAGTFLKKMSA